MKAWLHSVALLLLATTAAAIDVTLTHENKQGKSILTSKVSWNTNMRSMQRHVFKEDLGRKGRPVHTGQVYQASRKEYRVQRPNCVPRDMGME
jgi:hypothetical protein